MSSIDSTPTVPRSRTRRRLAAWAAFGAAGLAAGAVWATGFDTIGGSTSSNDPSPIVVPSDPAAHGPNLFGLVTAGADLTYDWDGRWGSVADTNLFTVNLTGKTGTYNIGFLLDNGDDLSTSGWSSIQFKVEAVEATGVGGTTCVASDFDGTNDPKVMAFDAEDAGVYWNGLAGNKVWCIGVNAADGHDTAGTFLRRDSDTVDPSVYPSFIATVDQAS